MVMLTLNDDITKINRIGEVISKKLKRIGIKTIADLLFYFPFRYDDFSNLTTIENLQPGLTANLVGQIELIQNKRSRHKRMYITEALISDETETIKAIWFNQPFIARNLKVGDKISLSGKIEENYGAIIMKSPVYEKIISSSTTHTQGLIPNYHLTANITQKQIRFLIKQIINLADKINEWLPEEIIKNQNLLGLNDAIKKIHFPKNQKDIEESRKRLAFNELFLLQLQSLLIKSELKATKTQSIPFMEDETKKFVNSLPFKLTNYQRKTSWEILKDIEKEKPMTRLLEGDVGSGKTIVAVIAMLNIALAKKIKAQSALMVPTEILAMQHYESICKLFKNLNITIGLITKSEKRINKNLGDEKIENLIKKGKINIIIGTHSLIQEKIKFKNLALAIIDEQHRFGVKQRKALMKKTENKKAYPHILSMTATPIPRSLALALYGDLDISIIKEMPLGRKNIITKIVPEEKREKAYNFIREQIKNNHQIFVVCPLIDFSDKLGVKSAKEEYKKLNEKIFPDFKIDILHGKMKSKEKEQIMKNFLENKTKILVSTSVVEVGVDAPNATIMIIEGAERFGLAQLHQFRGRVGRDKYQSYCFLFTENNSEKTIKRLNALISCYDGFELSKMDLKFRGPGEIYGVAQKGFPEFKIATLFDYELIIKTRNEAINLINKNHSLEKYSELKEKLKEYQNNNYLE